MKLLHILSAAATLTLATGVTQAETAWIRLSGPTLGGEATDAKHEGWIEVLTFEAEAREIDAGGRAGAFGIRKRIDKASPLLMRACAAGQTFREAVLHLAGPDPDGGGGRVFWEVLLRDVRLPAFSNESAGGSADERVRLEFASLRVTYYDIAGGSPPVVAETDPEFVDSDGDGMPDLWELAHGLNPEVPDGDGDLDGDGLSNLLEYHAGTSPRDSNSFFRAIGTTSGVGETFTIRWNSVPGRTYRVLHSADLSDPFQVIATIEANEAETVHQVPRNAAAGFFRVRLVTP
jgi:type VI secretion system Hcp family effector